MAEASVQTLWYVQHGLPSELVQQQSTFRLAPGMFVLEFSRTDVLSKWVLGRHIYAFDILFEHYRVRRY